MWDEERLKSWKINNKISDKFKNCTPNPISVHQCLGPSADAPKMGVRGT